MADNEFYTFSEYMRKDQDSLTPSGEDYVEMIYRLTRDTGFTRANDLASILNVHPPSVTKMVKKLAELNIIKYEKYGVIMLQKEGEIIGKQLLERHNLIEKFLELLDIKHGILEQTEKIEHTINKETLTGISNLLDFFSANPDIVKKFSEYQKRKRKRDG